MRQNVIKQHARPHCDAKESARFQMTSNEFESVTAPQKAAFDAYSTRSSESTSRLLKKSFCETVGV